MCQGLEVGTHGACLRKSRKRRADLDHSSHLQTATFRSPFLRSASEEGGSEGGTDPTVPGERARSLTVGLGTLGYSGGGEARTGKSQVLQRQCINRTCKQAAF